MPQKPQFVTGWFLPVDTSSHPEHPIELPDGERPPGKPDRPEFPGHPEHPIVLPPLVGIWPPKGKPTHPIVLPEPPNGPVYIEGTPEAPINSEPGTLSPGLPVGSVPSDKIALLVTVVGVPGERWLTYDGSTSAQPKQS